MVRGSMGLLLEDAWLTVRAHPGRTMVSFAALACGAASLAILLAALGGLQRHANRMVQDMGVDVFAAVASGSSAAESLVVRHAELLAVSLPDCQVSATRRHDRAFSTGREQVTVIQTDDRYADVRQRRVLAGRFIDGVDLRDADRVVVLTRALAARLRLDVGQVLRLRDTPFRVVGILEDGVPFLPGDAPLPESSSEELAAFVPRTTPAYWSPGDTATYRVDAIFLRALRGHAEAAEAKARRILGQKISPAAVLWINAETLVRKVERMQSVVRWSAGATTFLSMFMGGGVIFALMIASVRERVAEIGLRRSLGATRWGVASQFVVEAGFMAGVAAVAGCALANGALLMGQEQFPLPIHADALTWFVPIVSTLGVAIVGTIPACMLALGLSPADALRGE